VYYEDIRTITIATASEPAEIPGSGKKKPNDFVENFVLIFGKHSRAAG
jgi:hypothetical protein